MNAEYFGLGRRRALASCGSHRDFPLGGNAAFLQCRAAGAGLFGEAVSTQRWSRVLAAEPTPLKFRLRVVTLQNHV